ncbi:death-inducer obliterator 1 [Aphelenchoides avenae]|nr:death-inducer obliterator 1 [Aphelenchus avenae]
MFCSRFLEEIVSLIGAGGRPSHSTPETDFVSHLELSIDQRSRLLSATRKRSAVATHPFHAPANALLTEPFAPQRRASPPRRAASPQFRDAPPCSEGLSRVSGESWRRGEPDERAESPDPWITEPTHTIWNGTFNWENQHTFPASFLAVSNKAAFDLASELGHQSRVLGRIQPAVFWEYIESLKQSWNKQIIILLLETPREYREKYLMCHKIMLQERKFASLDFKDHPTVKNGYLLPMVANDPWPYQLPLDGPGLPMSKHFDNILAVIVRNTPPKPPPGARREESWVRRPGGPVSSDRDPYSRSLSRDDGRSRYSPDRQPYDAPRSGYSPATAHDPSGLRPPKQEIRDADEPAPLSRPPPPTRPPPQRDLSHVPPDPQSSAPVRSYPPELRRPAAAPAGPAEDHDGLPIANTLQDLLKAIENMEKPGQISLMVRKFILAHPELSQREKESISYAIKQKSMAGRAGVGGANRDGRLPPSQQVERGAPPPAAPIRQPDSYLARQEARGEFRPPPGGPLDRDETRERSRPSSETRQADYPRTQEGTQEPTHRAQSRPSSGIAQEDPPQPQERAHVSSAEIKEERHLQAPSAPREPSPGTKLLQLSAAYERLRPESQTSNVSESRATVSSSRPASSRSQRSEPSTAPLRNSQSSYADSSREDAPAQPVRGMAPAAQQIAIVGSEKPRPPEQPPPPERESPPPPPPPAQAGVGLPQDLPPPPPGMAYTVTYVQTPNGPMPVLVPTPVSQASGSAPSALASAALGAVASTSGTDMELSDDDCLIPPPPPPPPMETAPPPPPANSDWTEPSDEFQHDSSGRPLRGLFGVEEAGASGRQQFRQGPNAQRMPPPTMRYGQEEYMPMPYQPAQNNDPLDAPPGPPGPHSSNFGGPPPPGPPPQELLRTAAAVMQAAFERYETSYGVLREHAAPPDDRQAPPAYGRMPPHGPPPVGHRWRQ